jgi:hypothetical protein
MAWITLPSRSFASESPGFPVSPQDAAHYAHLRPRRTVKLRWERHVTPSLSLSSPLAICDGSCDPPFCYSLIRPSVSASVSKNRRFSRWI